MATMNSNTLLTQLQSDIRQIILQAEKLKALSSEHLQQTPQPGKWSVAQVLEHLNMYARFYTKAIEEKITGREGTAKTAFKTGWLGNYFYNMMLPQNGAVKKKMKAPKKAVPVAQPNGPQMLHEFIAHQHQLLNLLQICKTVSLNTRIPISISKFIKLKLGDTFRFITAHEQRHFLQIERAVQAVQTAQAA